MRLAYNEATPGDIAVLLARNPAATPERNALEFLAVAHAQLKHAASSMNAARFECDDIQVENHDHESAYAEWEDSCQENPHAAPRP